MEDGKITIDLKTIVEYAIIVLAIVGAIALVIVGYQHSPSAQPQVVYVPSTPVPTPVSTPVQQEVWGPFTVSGLTESGGFPQMNIREDSRAFKLSYSDYDNVRLGDRVYLTISGSYVPFSQTVYTVSAVDIIGRYYDRLTIGGNDYPLYYHDPSTRKFYQYDGRVTNEVSWKQVRGEQIIEGRPPHY